MPPAASNGFLLIDVLNMCVISPTGDQEYAALSFVSAGSPIFRTTKETLRNFLRTRDGLQAEEIANRKDRIPKVVWDAIWLTEAIGLRYLWVDALCIIEDDKTHKQRKSMLRRPSILKQSLLSWQCIEGQGRLDTDATQAIESWRSFMLSGGHVLIYSDKMPAFHKMLKGSHYESRGWTYQERALSQRCIYITPYGAYFQCAHRLAQEDGFESRDTGSSDMIGGGEGPVAWLRRFDWLTNPYHIGPSFTTFMQSLWKTIQGEIFSYPSDRLLAFTGITTAFQSVTGTGFIYGLAEAVFDTAIMWYRKPDRDDLSRASLLNDWNRTFVAPTWSWASREFPERNEHISLESPFSHRPYDDEGEPEKGREILLVSDYYIKEGASSLRKVRRGHIRQYTVMQSKEGPGPSEGF